MEVELKLSLNPADNDRLARHPLIAAHARAPARTAQLLAHYFDTPDLHLMRHGAGLRVRQVDGAWIQTMKAGGSVRSGLHQRNEWEGPVERPWPQLGRLRKLIKADGDASWLAPLDAPGLKQRLAAQFAVRVERRTWQLDVDGSAIELALDSGDVERHGRRVAINEIELELKAGDPAALFAFALRLLETIPLHVSNTNKAERGYALCRQSGTVPVKAADLALAPDGTLAEALEAMLSNCLAQIQGNEAGVMDTDNAESLHQMRVGMRRLRSALKLVQQVATAPEALQDDIAWLGEQLGQARDWDVLQLSTLAGVLDHPGANPGGKDSLALQDAVRETVQASRHAAALALRSPRYTRLLLALGAWMAQLARQREPDPDQDGDRDGDNDGGALAGPARHFAHHTLQRLHKTLLKRASRIDDDAASVHRLRIAGKRSRYALEFFQSLYRARDARRYLDAMSAIQDQLGRHNDLAVAGRLLRELQDERPALAGAVGYLRGYLRARQDDDGADLAKIVATLRGLALPQQARR